LNGLKKIDKNNFLKIIALFLMTHLFDAVYAESKIHSSLLSLQPIPSLTYEESKDKSFGFGFNCNKFFPVGFSKNGLFAYIVENSLASPSLVVTNLISDEQVAIQQFNDKTDTTQASKALFYLKIQDFKEKKLIRFPAVIDDDEYSVLIEGSNLILNSKLKGQKEISNLDSLQGFYLDYKKNDLLIEGFFRSPFEKRIVIILSGLYSGFEGEVDLLYFTVGAYLEDDFK
jgi:hypothetical protein